MTKNQSNNNITRATTRAWAEIDLSAIRDNFAAARDHAKKYGAETFAIMKANAYGHGAARVAAELQSAGAEHFAVATLDEALEMGIVNKSFDDFERQLVSDVITARIPAELDESRLFTK